MVLVFARYVYDSSVIYQTHDGGTDQATLYRTPEYERQKAAIITVLKCGRYAYLKLAPVIKNLMSIQTNQHCLEEYETVNEWTIWCCMTHR